MYQLELTPGFYNLIYIWFNGDNEERGIGKFDLSIKNSSRAHYSLTSPSDLAMFLGESPSGLISRRRVRKGLTQCEGSTPPGPVTLPLRSSSFIVKPPIASTKLNVSLFRRSGGSLGEPGKCDSSKKTNNGRLWGRPLLPLTLVF